MALSPNTAYLDCFSGISGDMLLGALISSGLSVSLLEQEFEKLKLDPFDFTVSQKKIQSISAVSVTIESRCKQEFRNLGAITAILQDSDLDKPIIDKSLTIFTRLAEAEAKVHGKPVDQIHFHEVGALDTIIDIVGTVAGFNLLNISQIYCSPLPLGRGFVNCAHGNLPLPAPAVCNLLEGVPVCGAESDKELVTPTGAVLASSLSNQFGTIPPMTVCSTGYGAGQHEGTEDRPNMLRLITGHRERVEEAQQVMIIETNLDDWTPEGFPFLCELLFRHNALDVSLSPIHMKKGRPGFCLQVICSLQHGPILKELILTETSAIGLRFREEQRITLPREPVQVSTPWGRISAKKVTTPAGIVTYPEYEDCRKAAEQHKIPLAQVYREVIKGADEH